jgi:hypothetical protein
MTSTQRASVGERPSMHCTAEDTATPCLQNGKLLDPFLALPLRLLPLSLGVTATSDKPREFTSVVSRAWHASVSSPLRREIHRTNTSASPRAEANAAALTTSILDTFSRASLLARVARSSTSLNRVAALSCVASASWEEASTTCTPRHRRPP